MKSHNEIKDIGREGRCCFLSLKLGLTTCFSYVVFASPSERRDFIMSFIYYSYVICDSHERTVNMGKEDFLLPYYLSVIEAAKLDMSA